MPLRQPQRRPLVERKRLVASYVYFEYVNSSQWVTTQPSGSRSSLGDVALDVPVGTTASTTQDSRVPKVRPRLLSPRWDPLSVLTTLQTNLVTSGGPPTPVCSTFGYPKQVKSRTPSGLPLTPLLLSLVETKVGRRVSLSNTPANNTTYTQGVEVLISEASPST